MKKLVAFVSAAGLALAITAQAGVVIKNSNLDDGVLIGVSSTIRHRFVGITQTAFVDEKVENKASTGDVDINSGEDTQGVLVVTGNATAMTEVGTEINSSDVNFGCECEQGSTANGDVLIDDINGDDPFVDGVATSDQNDAVIINSFEDVKTKVEAEAEAGDVDINSGDDTSDIEVRTGTAGSSLSRLISVGFARINWGL